MKGKHQRTQHNRQAQATAAELERLRAEIAAEAERGAAARAGAEQTRVARQRLDQEKATTERRLQPHEHTAARLVRAAMQASAAVAEARSELDAVERELSRFSDDTVQQLRQTGSKFRLPEVHRTADERFIDTWYRKKTGNQLENRRNVSLTKWIPEGTPPGLDSMRPFAMSNAADITPEACWAWAIPPWLAHPPATADDASELRRQLGATTGGAPRLPGRAYPGPPLRTGALLSTPWRHAPMIAEPADALELAYWYHRSAWAQQWHTDAPAPVPFWLPTEHAVGYPQARPLPPGTDIRLPYPNVFAVFSTGWRIDQRRTGDLPPELATQQLLMLYARGQAATYRPANLASHLARLQAAGRTDRDQFPTPLEALEHFGGVVEGLLLLASPDGTPRDEFAWCIAVGHPSGFPIARITVPASRSATTWRDQVDNITAGIALSCWHEPLPTATPETQRPESDAEETAAPSVRVLDIDATSPTSRSEQTGEPTHTTRPHLRRGHWRQQRIGAGRTETRWTWIRATTVNGLPDTAEQVYVLRPNQRQPSADPLPTKRQIP